MDPLKVASMSVAILLKNKKELKLVHWAARLATAQATPLLLIWTQHRRGASQVEVCQNLDKVPAALGPCCEELAENGFYFPPESRVDENGDEEPELKVYRIASDTIPQDVQKALEDEKVTCLVVPRDPTLRPRSAESMPLDYLISHLPCEIVLLSPGSREAGNCRELLTPVGDGPHSVSCLRLAFDLASSANAKLVALHVEPEIDETARLAAGQILSKTVDRALSNGYQEKVEQRVELANDVVAGIANAVEDRTDLIVVGIKRSGLSKRFSSSGIAGKLIEAQFGPTVAIVQSAMPISSRLGRKFDDWIRDWVPQLERSRRVDLVERVQRSSRWDFDFILLICLSTVIAAGGLLQDSAAVVIGAMLVAPLMTPLLGAGLAMVQGNHVLFRDTLFTVLRGFLVAFAIAIFVAIVAGWFLPVTITGELRARGQPTPLDILVALVGGVAAAYASGRPNLLSALPGVAIAAALVPPIATSGISLWLGDWGLSFRSALLFVTNIVAIILGTAMAFRATGVRGVHQHGSFDRWTTLAGATLFILTISLGVFESMPATDDGKSLRAVVNQVAAEETWTCTGAEWENFDGERVLTIRIQSANAMDDSRIRRVQAAIEKHQEDPTKLRFVTETIAEPKPESRSGTAPPE